MLSQQLVRRVKKLIQRESQFSQTRWIKYHLSPPFRWYYLLRYMEFSIAALHAGYCNARICEDVISPETHSIIYVKIIFIEEETVMGIRCKVLAVVRIFKLSLTEEHCEISQSQVPQQPKQLGTRKHTRWGITAWHRKTPQCRTVSH